MEGKSRRSMVAVINFALNYIFVSGSGEYEGHATPPNGVNGSGVASSVCFCKGKCDLGKSREWRLSRVRYPYPPDIGFGQIAICLLRPRTIDKASARFEFYGTVLGLGEHLEPMGLC